jgi:hypothetical protein
MIVATMQRKSIQEETSWQQCSGGQSMKKHRGNNVAEVNPQEEISAATMQQPIRNRGNNVAEANSWRNTTATMFPD